MHAGTRRGKRGWAPTATCGTPPPPPPYKQNSLYSPHTSPHPRTHTSRDTLLWHAYRRTFPPHCHPSATSCPPTASHLLPPFGFRTRDQRLLPCVFSGSATHISKLCCAQQQAGGEGRQRAAQDIQTLRRLTTCAVGPGRPVRRRQFTVVAVHQPDAFALLPITGLPGQHYSGTPLPTYPFLLPSADCRLDTGGTTTASCLGPEQPSTHTHHTTHHLLPIPHQANCSRTSHHTWVHGTCPHLHPPIAGTQTPCWDVPGPPTVRDHHGDGPRDHASFPAPTAALCGAYFLLFLAFTVQPL